METPHTEPSGRKRRDRVLSPLSLLVSVIREHGGGTASLSRHKATFIALIKEEGYEDFLDALIDEWVRIKYSTALSVASPPTPAEMKERLKARRERKANERVEIDRVKHEIKVRMLDFIMPNKKPLRKCTGGYCASIGGVFTKIGERVGPDELVGDVLSNKEIARML